MSDKATNQSSFGASIGATSGSDERGSTGGGGGGGDERFRQKLEGIFPDLLRKAFFAGLGAVFTTEEGVRKFATDFSLPKDAVAFLLSQAQSTKDDLLRAIAAEVGGFLRGLNVGDELQRMLTAISLEVKTEIRFIPNEARPKVTNKVAVKRNRPTEEVAVPTAESPTSTADVVDNPTATTEPVT